MAASERLLGDAMAGDGALFAGQDGVEAAWAITPSRRWLGYAAFAILALILAPLPHALWEAAGIHCPYM